MMKKKSINDEAKFIVRGIRDSIIVLLAAGASLASLYAFYNI
jgi:hypothetical protein